MRGTLLCGLLLLHTLQVLTDICSEEMSRLQDREKELRLRLRRQETTLQQLKQRSRGTTGTIRTTGATGQETELKECTACPVKVSPALPLRDCSEVFSAKSGSSGWYQVRTSSSPSLRVYCDSSGGGGWTVIQRRTDGSQSFNRSWDDYKRGFGDFETDSGEFWLGNDHLHAITAQGNYSLRINLMDFEGKRCYAEYSAFRVGNEQDLFRLSFGEYEGTAGDALSGTYEVGAVSWSSHQGANFSTYDQDNDNYQGNCAQEDQGGWWFNKCHGAHLNGRYYPGGHYSSWSDDGIVWYPWRGWWYSLRAVVMKIRPHGFKMATIDDPNAVNNKQTRSAQNK